VSALQRITDRCLEVQQDILESFVVEPPPKKVYAELRRSNHLGGVLQRMQASQPYIAGLIEYEGVLTLIGLRHNDLTQIDCVASAVK
jgi:hypothetical protein